MTAIATASPRPVLAEALLPEAATRSGITVLAGAALTAVCAQVALPIPGSPVPVTGQTFAVLVVAAALGPTRGLASQGLYLALGLLGLPVFGHGAHGVHVILGATGGYLVGFLFAALLVGAASRRGADRSIPRELGVLTLASLVIYLMGAGWLAVVTGMTAAQAFAAGVAPFVAGDAVKLGLASVALPAAWKLAGHSSNVRHDR
ncbi:MAG: biotin transporter BioY [Mycobacteriaceae bacterium]